MSKKHIKNTHNFPVRVKKVTQIFTFFPPKVASLLTLFAGNNTDLLFTHLKEISYLLLVITRAITDALSDEVEVCIL